VPEAAIYEQSDFRFGPSEVRLPHDSPLLSIAAYAAKLQESFHFDFGCPA
jgi:hypothetical protein